MKYTAVLILGLVFMSQMAYSSESTIVLMDNATIKTVHHYEKLDKTAESSTNWEDVAIIDPTAEAACFDKVSEYKNRADRYQQIDRCLDSVTGAAA